MTRRILQRGGGLMVALLLAGPAAAQVQITDLIANGTGCPRGSVDVLMLGDQASVLFNSYNVTTTSRAPIQTRSCNVAVGLRLDPGISVTLSQIQWMGTMTLAPGSVGIFNRDLRFANRPGVRRTQVFTRAFNPIDPVDVLGGVTISGCRNPTAIARVNTSLTIMGAGAGEIQSADLASFSRILLGLRRSRVRCDRFGGGGVVDPRFDPRFGGDGFVDPRFDPGFGGFGLDPRFGDAGQGGKDVPLLPAPRRSGFRRF